MGEEKRTTLWILWPFVALWQLVGTILALTGRLVAVILGLALLMVGIVLSATIIGAFVIGVLAAGMIMYGVSSFWQQVIKGVVIVAAVIIDQIQARMQDRVALQKQQELEKMEEQASGA